MLDILTTLRNYPPRGRSKSYQNFLVQYILPEIAICTRLVTSQTREWSENFRITCLLPNCRSLCNVRLTSRFTHRKSHYIFLQLVTLTKIGNIASWLRSRGCKTLCPTRLRAMSPSDDVTSPFGHVTLGSKAPCTSLNAKNVKLGILRKRLRFLTLFRNPALERCS